jgi:hypothetical protein
MWRTLITRKRFGFGYGESEDPKAGSMATFCALCAQPGINLPADWRLYKNRWVIVIATWKLPTFHFSKNLFMRGFMMDGNFQAEHMKMRNPENDVPLSDGAGFMVSKKPYELHLKSAVERRQVRSISHISAGIFSRFDRGQRVMITARSTTKTSMAAILNPLELGLRHACMGPLCQTL